MSAAPTDPLPMDIQQTLARLAGSAGLDPVVVLREALDLFARELEDQQALDRAEQITLRRAELDAILALNPRPSTWHDSDEPLY
jgi:hypothetical protein